MRYKNWVVDVPGECLGIILDDRKEGYKNPEDLEEMEYLIKNACPEWAK